VNPVGWRGKEKIKETENPSDGTVITIIAGHYAERKNIQSIINELGFEGALDITRDWF
jgi:hypothetical protein